MNVVAHHGWLLIVPVLLSAGTGALLIKLAVRINWFDHPHGRKAHEHPTPVVGGSAIFIAVVVGMNLLPGQAVVTEPFYWMLISGAWVILLLGLVDDISGLSSMVRLLLQIGLCLLMARYSGVRLDDFGQLFSSDVLSLGWLALPVTVFSVVGVINATNLVDGMDGVAGTIFLVAVAGMSGFAAAAGQYQMLWLLLILAGAALGFLLLNARFPWNEQARTFLGNSGALMLGFILAWSFVRLGSGADRVFMPMTAVWLFAVPLLDTSTLIWVRFREGRSAFAADQRHLHHACLQAGFSIRQSWLIISGLAIALALCGIGFELGDLPGYVSFYTFMVMAFSYYFYLNRAWKQQKFLGRHFIHQGDSI